MILLKQNKKAQLVAGLFYLSSLFKKLFAWYHLSFRFLLVKPLGL
jgi:hypothetical protein